MTLRLCAKEKILHSLQNNFSVSYYLFWYYSCMKTYKLLLFALLFSVWANAGAQIHNVSSVNFTYIDLLNYASFCREDIAHRIEKTIDDGKLTVCHDAELKKPVTYNEYYKLIEDKYQVQIPNPNNPDDIYDLIDTFIISYKGPKNFTLNDDGGIEILCGSGAKLYMNNKKLKKLLDKRLLALLDYFELKGLKTISDTSFVTFFKQEVKQLGFALYNYGVNGEVPPYRNDSLASTFTIDEIKERLIERETKQIPNPYNPDDIYDLIDTVIIIPFIPENINKVRLYFKWETDGFENSAEFFAIAPSFNPVVSGLMLGPTPIFNIKAADYLKRISKQEKAFYTYFYSYMLQNRSANSEYDLYDDMHLPAE